MLREKKYKCGDFLEVEIFKANNHCKKYKRRKKVQESTPAQRNLNSKKSKRHFIRLVHLNFTNKDLYVDLTYSQENLPSSREEVIRDVKNYIARLKRARNKLGIKESLKYIYVISNLDTDGNKVRYQAWIEM